MPDEDNDAQVEVENHACRACGELFSVIKMDFRFAGRYTCPHCGRDVVLSDAPEE